MRMLDLFAGIGGFSLAAHWMGWETTAFVEWDSFAQKVLRKNFPNVPIHGDIKQFNGSQYKGSVDIICGGFPCQPFSTAGKRKGENDDRYLWPEMLRVISEVRPTWIVGENVAGLLSMDGGGVFDEICTSLENEGYQVEAFVIPACATGAPHRRDRVWIIAYDFSKRRRPEETGRLDLDGGILENTGRKKNTVGCPAYCGEFERHTPNSNSERLQGAVCGKFRSVPKETGTPARREPGRAFSALKKWDKHWMEVATRLCRVDDGIPRGVDRSKRLKALGNAIVPQVAYEIFSAIQTTDV